MHYFVLFFSYTAYEYLAILTKMGHPIHMGYFLLKT